MDAASSCLCGLLKARKGAGCRCPRDDPSVRARKGASPKEGFLCLGKALPVLPVDPAGRKPQEDLLITNQPEWLRGACCFGEMYRNGRHWSYSALNYNAFPSPGAHTMTPAKPRSPA